MVVQLVIYFMFFPLYNWFQTFQFINNFPFEEHVFLLKSQVTLNELEPNSTHIMCSSIINRYTDRPNQCESLLLVKFNYFYKIKK